MIEKNNRAEFVTSMVDVSPVGMLLVNNSGTLVFSNKKAEAIFGYSNKDLLGSSIDQLIPVSHRDKHE